MPTVRDITDFLKSYAPTDLAEEWDNVGLLVGDDSRHVESVMTCLTLTPDVAAEAVRERAGLVVSHHPVLFRPVQRLTSETPEGRMLLDLIASGIALYSPHTGYDSAREGINRQLAERLDLRDIRPLRPREADALDGQPAAPVGGGRFGRLPTATTLAEFNETVKRRLEIDHLKFVGDRQSEISRVGIACGSAAEFLHDARRENCQLLLTGEARFHACLEAQSVGINLVLVGHYASERPAMEHLAEILGSQFPRLPVWPSREERDPVQWG